MINNSNRLTLKLSLYTSSIVIGAGLLTLPTTAAKLGFIPLIATIIFIGIWMAFVSRKTASSLFYYANEEAKKEQKAFMAGINRASAGKVEPHGHWANMKNILSDTVRTSGPLLLPRLTNAAGYGVAGKVTILLGMTFYVIFADIGYTILGGRALQSITLHAQNTLPGIFYFLFIFGILSGLFVWKFDKFFQTPFLLRGTIKKILVMLCSWILGIALLGIINIGFENYESIWYDLLTKAVFFGAVIACMYTRTPTYNKNQSSGMEDQHTVNMLVMIFEIFLLLATIGIMFWVSSVYKIMVPFYAFSSTSFMFTWENLEEWAVMIGVVIFSLVGTGLYNLLSYPELFEPDKNSQSTRLISVVNLGTAIPTFIYLVWTIAISLTLSQTILVNANISKLPLTIPIADKFVNYDPNAAWLIIFFGYFLSLLAVTSACNGFTESLADQIHAALPNNQINSHNRPKNINSRNKNGVQHSLQQRFIQWLSTEKDNLSVRFIILLGAFLAAFFIDNFISIDISSILSIAGNAGGGLLILILPFFLTGPDGKRSPWSSIMTGVGSAFILTTLSLTASRLDPSQGIISSMVSMICFVIGLSILIVTFWLMFNEIKIRRQNNS